MTTSGHVTARQSTRPRAYSEAVPRRVDVVLVVVALVLLVPLLVSIRNTLRGAGVPAAGPPVGTLSSPIGAVRRRPAQQLGWDRVHGGDPIWRGDGIYAPKDAAVTVVFNDGTRLDIGEQSLIVVEPREEQSETPMTVTVRRGRVRGTAGRSGVQVHAGGGSTLLTPQSEATVERGLEEEMWVAVRAGQAQVREHAGRESANVGPLQQATVGGGEGVRRIDLPVQLDAPEPNAQLYVNGDRVDVSFQWRGAPAGAVLEVAGEPTFATPSVRIPAESGSYHADGLRLGYHYWRVVAGDGAPLSHRRSLLIVRERQPHLLKPSPGAILYLPPGRSSRLMWTHVPGADRYAVEIGTDKAMLRIVKVIESDAAESDLRGGLPEGVYYWRARALAEGRDPPASRAQPFRLITEALPRPPDVYDPELRLEDDAVPLPVGRETTSERPEESPEDSDEVIEDELDEIQTELGEQGAAPPPVRGPSWTEHAWRSLGWLIGGVAHAAEDDAAAKPKASLVLRWEAVEGVNRYAVQVARDPEFKDVVFTKEVEGTYYRWPVVLTEPHWYRVKSIDARGRHGTYGLPRRIGAALDAPDILAPRDGAALVIGADFPKVALRWSSERLASSYEVQTSMSADFTGDVENHSSAAVELAWRPSRAGVVYWRVRSVDSRGGTTAYSPARRLRVGLAAPEPVAAPLVAFLGGDAPVTIETSPVATASVYELHVVHSAEPEARDGSETLEVSESREIAETREEPDSPEEQKSLEEAHVLAEVKSDGPAIAWRPEEPGEVLWRVRAADEWGNTSPWSQLVPLRIELAAPVITAPAGAGPVEFRGAPPAIDVRWNPTFGAECYVVTLTDIARGEEVAFRELEGTDVTIAEIGPGSYEARVVAHRGEHTSAPGLVRLDRALLPPLAAPVLEEPADDHVVLLTGRPPELRFAWRTVLGAARYELYLASSTARDRLPAADAWRAESASDASTITLVPHERGYVSWRVRAVDPDGVVGPLSEPRTLYYGPPPPLTKIEVAPAPVVVGPDSVADVRITVRNADGVPATLPLRVDVERGRISDLHQQSPGRWTARYRPPDEVGASGDRLVVASLEGPPLRLEHSISLEEPADSFGVGLILGPVANFGSVLDPAPGLEASYRLPWLGGLLSVDLRLMYHFADLEGSGGRAEQHSVPVTLGLRVDLPVLFGVVVPYAAADFAAGILYGRIQVEDLPVIERTLPAVGVGARAGAAFELGPGLLFAEIGYLWLRQSDDIFTLDGGGLRPLVGYRFVL